MWFDWTPYMNQKGDAEIESAFNQQRFKELAQIAFTPPKNFVLQRQVEKILPIELKWLKGNIPVNWGFAENMAYATLLDQGYPIRFTGQDIRRGTFSHRHAVVLNQKDGIGRNAISEIAEQCEYNYRYL